MPFSSNVVDQEDTLASQYNNLRKDILDASQGHTHAGTASTGTKIDHGNLTDNAAIPSTYLKHATLSKHVQGALQGTDPDLGGGSNGVHGLPSTAFVMGCVTGAVTVQYGETDLVESAIHVDFPVAFATVPTVFVTYAGSRPAPGGTSYTGGPVYSQDVTVDHFTAHASSPEWYGAHIAWMAIGAYTT
jgi:hypothetical protein